MHSQLLHSMRSRAHRPVKPGDVILATKEEALERMRPTSEGIASLSVDVRNVLVYGDCTGYRAAAETAEKVIAEPDAEGPCTEKIRDQIKVLRYHADILEKRAEGKEDVIVARQINFCERFFLFEANFHKYSVFLHEQQGEIHMKEYLMIDGADFEYRKFVEQFRGLGFSPSYFPPKDYLPTDRPLEAKKIPTEKLVIVGVGLAVFAYYALRKTPNTLETIAELAETERAEEPMIGPPQTRQIPELAEGSES